MLKLLLISIFTFGFVNAQGIKIGIVDIEKIGENLQEAKDIEKDLLDLNQRYTDTLQQMQKSLEEDFKNYQKQKAMMTIEKQQQTEQELNQRNQTLQLYYQEKMGQNGELFKRRAELLEPVRKKITDAINTISKQQGLSIVLDKSNPGLLFSEEKLEITFKVLDLIKTGK